MKLENFKEAAYFYTEKTSELTRQLAYSGIAIIWIFKIAGPVQSSPNYQIPLFLSIPLILLVITLLLDFLHYAYGAIVWMQFHRKMEVDGYKESDDLKAPFKYTKRINLFWKTKIILVIIGYFFLLVFLINTLF